MTMNASTSRTEQLVGSNLNARLAWTCRRLGEKTALIDPSGSWTFGQLWKLSAATSKLVSGLTSRERVGIMLPAVKEFAAAWYGALLAGKCVVPINFLLAGAEMRKVAQDADLDCIITSRALVSRLTDFDLPCVFIEDVKEALTAAAGSKTGVEVPESALGIDPGQPAVIIYTAGTTDEPKGVVLSHGNLLSNTDGCVEALDLDEHFKLLASLPFFHVFGLTTGLVMPVAFGATTVMLPKFSVQGLLGMVKEHEVDIILTIPSMWTVLVRSGALVRGEFPSLQICISGGEPLPAETASGFQRMMEMPLLEGYGMTETSPVICLSHPGRHRSGSVGEPLPGVKVRVAGEDGSVLGPNGEGEIQVKGPNVMQGYHGRPEMTRRAMTSDGWLKTGDRGRFDANGCLSITGRVKDLIITGGENVNPREVEEVLLTYPGVLEAAVVGVPSGSRGEVVGAFMVAAPGSNVDLAELKAFCRKHLASYKVPRVIEFLSELPRNYAGKVLKRKLVR